MKLKSEITIGSILAGIVLVFALIYLGQGVASGSTVNTQTQQNQQTQTSTVTNSTHTITLTNSEVAKHSSRQDCWLIISNQVYDTTSYIRLHPGGSQAIVQYCGKEATTAFDTQGGMGIHSSRASQELAQLRIGALNETITL